MDSVSFEKGEYALVSQKWKNCEGKDEWAYYLFKGEQYVLHCGYGGSEPPTEEDFERIVRSYELLVDNRKTDGNISSKP